MTDFNVKYWKAIEDYCNGVNLREIAKKYKCYEGHVVKLAREIGITPRPTGFASYTIAHAWVTQARVEFETIMKKKNIND